MCASPVSGQSSKVRYGSPLHSATDSDSASKSDACGRAVGCCVKENTSHDLVITNSAGYRKEGRVVVKWRGGGGAQSDAAEPATPPFPPSCLVTLHALSLSLSHTDFQTHHTHRIFHNFLFTWRLSLSLSHTHTQIVHTFLLNPTHTHDCVLHQQRMLKIAWPEIHPTSASLLSLLFFHPPPPPPPSTSSALLPTTTLSLSGRQSSTVV